MESILTIIIVKSDEYKFQKILECLSNDIKKCDINFKIISVDSNKNVYAEYNKIIKIYPAKYRVYISDKVECIGGILKAIIEFFKRNPSCGILGFYGGVLPLNGDLHNLSSKYGTYYYNSSLTYYENPLFSQRVDTIDSAMFATSIDIPWDIDMKTFALSAQCLKMNRYDKNAMVMMVNGAIIKCNLFSDFDVNQIFDDYDNQRVKFYQRYINELNPLVSVLIPTYNSPDFFHEALKSALAQDYPNIEILVGDDSTDTRTAELMKQYSSYSNIKYFNHGGPLGEKGYINGQFLLNSAKGEYINYLLHDDIFYPTKISRMMEVLKADIDGKIGAVSSIRHLIDSAGNVIYNNAAHWKPTKKECLRGDNTIVKLLINNWNFIGETTTVLQRKEMYQKKSGNIMMTGYYYEMRDRYYGDISMWLDILRKKDIVFLPDTLSAFRLHPDQNTNDNEMASAGLMQWINFAVITWLHHDFIDTGTLYICMDNWLNNYKEELFKMIIRGEKTYIQDILKSLVEYISNRQYDRVIDLSITYMLKYCDAEGLEYFCQKNSCGYWTRRT